MKYRVTRDEATIAFLPTEAALWRFLWRISFHIFDPEEQKRIRVELRS